MDLLIKKLKISITAGDTLVEIHGSIGVSLYPEDGKNFEILYKKADMALYEAKRNGKDQYRIYKQQDQLK